MNQNSTPPVIKNVNIKLSFSLLTILFVILALLITAILIIDYFSPGWKLDFRDYLSVGSFGAVTIGLIYNAVALQYNFELNKLRLEREDNELKEKKTKITYEAMSDYHRSDMAKNREIAKRFVRPYKNKLSKQEMLDEFISKLYEEEHIETRMALISLLNYFEHLSLLCADNVIDEEILRKAFRTAFITLYWSVKEYIIWEQSGNAGANAKIYVNYVQTCNKWQNS